MELKLSIAIPTFGSPEAVTQNVKNILKCKHQNIEVIIVDNDETGVQLKDILNQVTDSRFRYYKNDKNIGRNNNIARAAEVSGADHVLLMSSDDELYLDALDEIMQILDSDPSCGLILGTMKDSMGGTSFPPVEPGTYRKGYEAFLNLPVLGNLVPMVINKNYLDFDKLYNVQEYYMQVRMALYAAGQGDFVYIKSKMGYAIANEEIIANKNICEPLRRGTNIKASWDVRISGSAYCSDDARILQLKQYISIIEGFPMRLNQKLKVVDAWTTYFVTLAIGYVTACQSPSHISNCGFDGTYTYRDILGKMEYELNMFFAEREAKGEYFFTGRLGDIIKNELILLKQAENILADIQNNEIVSIHDRDSRITMNLHKLLELMQIKSVILSSEENLKDRVILVSGMYDQELDASLKERGALKIHFMDRMAKYLAIVWCSMHQQPENFAEYVMYTGR